MYSDQGYINYCTHVLKILKYLSISKNGLSDEELSYLLNLENGSPQLQLVYYKMKGVIRKLGRLWWLVDPGFKGFIRKRVLDKSQKLRMHKEVVKSYKFTLNAVLPLVEEKIYHLYKSKDYSSLKQALTDIEYFLLLFHQDNKLQLFYYWKQLEKVGYEPVEEYSKSIENFDSRTTLTSKDLFMIILQMTRFFKEFGDFEVRWTPSFQHPLIQNKHAIKTDEEHKKDSINQLDKTEQWRRARRSPGESPNSSMNSTLRRIEKDAPNHTSKFFGRPSS
jgi:hypothetical protein